MLIKKLISAILSISILTSVASISVQAAPASPSIVSTVVVGGKTFKSTTTESNNVKTVVVEDGITKSTVVYNYNLKTLKTTEYNNKTKVTTTSTVNLNSISSTKGNPILSANGDILTDRSDWWWGYQCKARQLTPQNRWYVKTDFGNKTVYENSNNLTNLQAFRAAVNSMCNYQVAAIAALGTAGASTIAAIISAAPTIGLGTILGAVVAIGGSFTAAYSCYCAYLSSTDCDYYFRIIS
jgi:hypothetical protein